MLKIISSVIISSLLISSAYAADNDLKQRAQESKKVVKEFMQQLKGELQSAMKAGGPINAIDVCKIKAPAIAQNLSEKHGWKVARTSLKPRNPSNAPDAWETRVLNDFEARKAEGEDVMPMAHFEAVESDGEKAFRFMKAIPTGEVCLTCHGSDIDPKVKAKLQQAYPEDKATGFKLGDIRGAFTISQPM